MHAYPQWWYIWRPLAYSTLSDGAADSLSSTVLSSLDVQAACSSLCSSVESLDICTCSVLDLEPFPPDTHMALYSPKRPFLTIHAQIAPLKSLAPYYALCFFIAFVSTCHNTFLTLFLSSPLESNLDGARNLFCSLLSTSVSRSWYSQSE